MKANEIFKMIVDSMGLKEFKVVDSKTGEDTTDGYIWSFDEEVNEFVLTKGDKKLLFNNKAAGTALVGIMEEQLKIIPAPFVPKDGDTIWYYESLEFNPIQDEWDSKNVPLLALAQMGLIFRSEKEAIKGLPKVKETLGRDK